jgi:hypothetical protein
MPGNYLEQLIAEWYEYQGYFVRRNVLVGKRAKGGYAGELDVIAFSPTLNHLVHVEPSMDADSWTRREERYLKKFQLGRLHIPTLFEGFKLPDKIEQIALLGFGSKANHQTLAGGKILLVPELLEEIFSALKLKNIARNAVSENMPLLRTLQFVSDNWQAVHDVMGDINIVE